MGDPEAGTAFGPYALEEELGRGPMGAVFRARRDGGEPVALKLLPDDLAADETFRRRFEREVRIARSLDHPHIASVVDAGEVDGRPYLASRLVEGPSLADELTAHGPRRAPETVDVVAQVASALDALHAEGLVHRDVKPANILLAADGTAVLSDFGLARGRADTVLTAPGRVSGTVDYLAPELIRGGVATTASDVYALGCVAYECASGAPPFADKPVAEAVIAHLQEAPPPLASPIGEAILQALAKEPEQRPPTATAYALMLAVSLR
jgi:serine/threonine protein kinase